MGTQRNRLNETVFEHPKHTFQLMGKKIIKILRKLDVLIWTYDKLLDTLLVFLREFFEKSYFEKSQQKKNDLACK